MTESGKHFLVIMNVSGIYENWQNPPENAVWISCRDITGTNCYCDDSAAETLRSRISSESVAGIHCIDSGNYHYLTKFWMEKYKADFQLLMLDNHTDLQPPAFGGILSCGGWLFDSMEEMENLKKVLLIGPGEEDYAPVQENLKERIRFFSKEYLRSSREELLDPAERSSWIREVLQELDPKLPLYISIDKDVLCTEDARTTWSQGDMRLTELMALLEEILIWKRENEEIILGIDLCGSCDMENAEDNGLNERADLAIIQLMQR
ncbi:MAG: arginase family protein [Eubacteriales bacterium]|nr:arginase family protein [Eubacteriales bacterium]